jgi:hypothetical protein
MGSLHHKGKHDIGEIDDTHAPSVFPRIMGAYIIWGSMVHNSARTDHLPKTMCNSNPYFIEVMVPIS